MQASGSYDPRSALQAYAPGVVLTREVEQSLVQRYADKGCQPLTAADVLAITGPAPSPVTSIPFLPLEGL